MAFIVEIDTEARMLHTTCSDIVSCADLVSYGEEHWLTAEQQGFNHCIDFSGCLMDISEAELFAIATGSISSNSSYEGARTSLVVADDLQAELAEFYRAARHEICDPGIREVGIFRDLEAALCWVQASNAPVRQVG